MIRLKPPAGARFANVQGTPYEVDEHGYFNVSDEHAPELLPHGFVVAQDGTESPPVETHVAAAAEVQKQRDALDAERQAFEAERAAFLAERQAAADAAAAADKAATDKPAKGAK